MRLDDHFVGYFDHSDKFDHFGLDDSDHFDHCGHLNLMLESSFPQYRHVMMHDNDDRDDDGGGDDGGWDNCYHGLLTIACKGSY